MPKIEVKKKNEKLSRHKSDVPVKRVRAQKNKLCITATIKLCHASEKEKKKQ